MNLQWKPIETAPKDGTEILLCRATDTDGGIIEAADWGIFIQVAAWWSGENDWIVFCSLPSEPRLHFMPTHWAELPANPLIQQDSQSRQQTLDSWERENCRRELQDRRDAEIGRMGGGG